MAACFTIRKVASPIVIVVVVAVVGVTLGALVRLSGEDGTEAATVAYPGDAVFFLVSRLR